MTGGVVSTIPTLVQQVTGGALPSETETLMECCPSVRTGVAMSVAEVGGPPAGTLFVCNGVPSTTQTTVSASPSASATWIVTSTVVPAGPVHSRLAGAGQAMVGGVLTGIN